MIIKARNLSKKVIFNGEEINILDKIDLDISSNTSLAVVGPSGSGKSTLLGLLADWILLQEGNILRRYASSFHVRR